MLSRILPVVTGLGLAFISQSGIVHAATYDLTIGETQVDVSGSQKTAMTVNGSLPAPTLRFTEGEDVVINVTNTLKVQSSIHWHGFILPYQMDGVPGMSFPGIAPGETFTYRFPLVQNGTYWYHSHSGLQEQAGVYGAIIVEPKKKDPVKADRDYIVMLSDWTDEDPHAILMNLKKQSDYYNFNKRTVADFFRDTKESGLAETLENRRMWGEMRMDPTDLADVTGYTFLVNGRNPDQNWTAIFNPGERVRLRFVNGSAMTIFDIKIPGLKMKVVAADGQYVRPTEVDALRISVAETYDVLVEPAEDYAFTVFAESMDRTGYARATLAPREGMSAEIPEMSPRKVLTMADMGAAHGGMDHGGMAMGDSGTGGMDHSQMTGMDHSNMKGMDHSAMPGMDHSNMKGMDHSKMSMPNAAKPDDGPRVLQYADLKSLIPYPQKEPERELVLRLTGNMERYFWSINDKKFSEAEPIRFRHNERVRVKFVNETMMNHPMHLHGHWMELDNGAGVFRPRKHVINVSPGETVYFDLTADALGEWAFHCHMLYHMATGMMRKVIVEPAPTGNS